MSTISHPILRSAEWFERDDELGLQHRAVLRQAGLDPSQCAGRPIIAIANSWSEFNPCNLGLRDLAPYVRRGIEAAGGVPLEFNTLSLGEELMKPSAMLYRNLLAMEIEELLRSYPIDGVVLLGGCDKTIPAQLMAAASSNIPALLMAAGPKTTGVFDGEPIGSGTALWHYGDARRAHRLSDKQWQELERAYAGSVGTCNVMGTASTMAIVTETLGLMVPGSALIRATDPRRTVAAEQTGAAVVDLVRRDLRPSNFLTQAAFTNALHAFLAVGGSTNAILHLIAIARRLRLPLGLDDFDRLARDVPVLTDLQPAGSRLVGALDDVGGVPALLRVLASRLDLSCHAGTGTWAEALQQTQRLSDDTTRSVIRSFEAPVQPAPGLVVLRGSLAPLGAVLRLATASPRLARHIGEAVVFRDYDDMRARIDAPDLLVTADSVLVLQQAGAAGVPGFPEWGNIPIPAKLLRQGVKDIVRVSDSRMSGTAAGTVILHVAPESARGGPLALVRDGDRIALDSDARQIDLLVPETELNVRRAAWTPPSRRHLRGYPALYIDSVLGPEDGCDFDFLVPRDDAALTFVHPIVGRS